MDWRALRRWLLAGVAVVAVLGLAAELAHAYAPTDLGEALLPKLSLSYEQNLPTWFSSSLLLLCAIAAGAIASRPPPMRLHWWGMAVVAGWMSLDEAAEIHEHLAGHFNTHGVLYFDWVIPATAIVIALALVYVPFVRRLESATRTRLIIAATIYVGGALMMELPLGWITESRGIENLAYALVDWVEETMEMIGAALAFVALVAHRNSGVQR
ncbi:MAG TPA: hypothetical protein VMZ53_05755 [Kofleriaceae bacterium]|nr:hypothetical protein [Kofleriaceae bacterium]